MGEIVLVRHGQTEWSANGRHTSYTDIALTKDGEREARGVGTALDGRAFVAVYSSPRARARRTAELAGLAVTGVVEELAEWNYGAYEGLTTPEIRERRPGWLLWRDGCPDGESAADVGARLDLVLDRAGPDLDRGDVALVAHGHCLRVAAARWVGLAAGAGMLLRLDTGTLSELGYEHEWPVIRQWNAPV